MIKRRWHIIAYIYLLTILIAWLASYILRYAWQRNSPMRMVYVTDIARYANATWARRRIPRLIHQVWSTHNVPLQWNATYQSVITKNVGEFKHHLWTDAERHAFVQKHEPHFYKNTYITYPYEIQRVDSFRYVLLYHLGGIYTDMDNGCNRPFNDLLTTLEALDSESSHLAAFPEREGSGVESDFLASTAGHPLYKQLISRLHLFNHNYLFPFYTVFFSTGPWYVSIQERFFTLSRVQTVRILDEKTLLHMFLWRAPGRTWFRLDAPIIFYLDTQLGLIFRCFKIFTLLLIGFLFISWCRSQRRWLYTAPTYGQSNYQYQQKSYRST